MSVVCHMLFLIRVFRIRIELFKHIIQTLWMLNPVNLPIIIFTGAVFAPIWWLHPCNITFLGELMNALIHRCWFSSSGVWCLLRVSNLLGRDRTDHGGVQLRAGRWESNLVCWTCFYGTYCIQPFPRHITSEWISVSCCRKRVWLGRIGS